MEKWNFPIMLRGHKSMKAFWTSHTLKFLSEGTHKFYNAVM